MNELMTIVPYVHNGVWVFDDEQYQLEREPFIKGASEGIDLLLAQANIPLHEARDGFLLTFSRGPFAGATRCELVGPSTFQIWTPDDGWVEMTHGHDYRLMLFVPHDLWLCPALLHYFEEAPPVLYAAASRLEER